MAEPTPYSIPEEARKLFLDGVLANPLISKNLPEGVADAAQSILFKGSDAPTLPVNWRFAESIASLKALEASVLHVLLKRKYGVAPRQVVIDTDHAQLFILSFALWVLDPAGAALTAASLLKAEGRAELPKYFPSWEKSESGLAVNSLYRVAATNIYKTKDGKYFHLHGSLNPDVILEALGLPKEMECQTPEASWEPFKEAIGKLTADELQSLADTHRQAGTICLTADEYRSSEHGKANADTALFEITAHPSPEQPAAWWPDSPATSAARPLAGLKVVELTRVIAGPVIGRSLAELGASVMRVTAPHLPDTSVLHPDTNHGKWNACLDLRLPGHREALRRLVLDADVFLQGYRPGVLDKYGFGERDVLAMCAGRGRGIVYATENCYGWRGPWAGRSGWQQISDANCGISYGFGRAMGHDEPVTPIFPNSDYCTGVSGAVGIITALIRRAEEGGSYTVRTALNYYSQWLADICGEYPQAVWESLRERCGLPAFRHYHDMQKTLPAVFPWLFRSGLFKPEFFTEYHVGNLGKTVRIVAPVLQYPENEVKPGYHVGTRTNGVDKPRWPSKLDVEVVTEDN